MAFSIFDRPLAVSKFSHENIQEYILKINETNQGNGYSAVLKDSINGSKLFKAGFVGKFLFQEIVNGSVVVSADVKAEYKKMIYKVNMTISSDNEVLSAACECPGGAPPACCKHTFAVLCLIGDYCTKELHSAPTERLQVWHQPAKKKKLSPKKTDIFKRKTDMSVNAVSTVNFAALKNLPLDAPIFNIVDSRDFDLAEHLISLTLPLPALQPEEVKTDVFLSITVTDPFQILFIDAKLRKTLEECHRIEKETIGQNSVMWTTERSLRVTSSNFHRVITRRADFDALCQSLVHPKDIDHIPAVKFGKDNEHSVKQFIRQNYKNKTFRDVGFVINPNFPFIGSSPDGLLVSTEEQALVEIKSVFNKKLSLGELAQKHNFCLEECNGKFNLKRGHAYYTQIQGQLGICNLKKCFFFLSYGDSSMHVEEVDFNAEFWNNCLNSVKHFYFNYYIKYVS